MSFIELSTPVPNTKKAVISFWFRIPKVTMDAAMKEADDWRNGRVGWRKFLGVIPLVVLGPKIYMKGINTTSIRTVGTVPGQDAWSWADGTTFDPCGLREWSLWDHDFPSVPRTATYLTLDGTQSEIEPSYIGVSCLDYPSLSINLATPTGSKATTDGLLYQLSSFSSNAGDVTGRVINSGVCEGAPVVNAYPGSGHPFCVELVSANPPPGINPIYTNTFVYDYAGDLVYGGRPEMIRSLPFIDSFPNVARSISPYSGPRITEDHWHHVLISFDLTKSCETSGALVTSNRTYHVGSQVSTRVDINEPADDETAGSRVKSACRMWTAIDDVNMTKKNLSCYWPTGYNDSNGVTTVVGAIVMNTTNYNITQTTDDCIGNRQTTVDVHRKPTYSFTPDDVPFSDMMFGFPANGENSEYIRNVEMAEFQMFTDVFIDTGIKSNRRAFITDEGKPASIGKAEELLGKKPEVLLHGSSNWKKGRNTGSLADNPVSDGVHVGEIDTYKPNPNLYGKQGS